MLFKADTEADYYGLTTKGTLMAGIEALQEVRSMSVGPSAAQLLERTLAVLPVTDEDVLLK